MVRVMSLLHQYVWKIPDNCWGFFISVRIFYIFINTHRDSIMEGKIYENRNWKHRSKNKTHRTHLILLFIKTERKNCGLLKEGQWACIVDYQKIDFSRSDYNKGKRVLIKWIVNTITVTSISVQRLHQKYQS